jgi:fructose-bisphosphate aldolase, class I
LDASILQDIARALVAEGRGFLAADESFPTIKKRFESFGIPDTEDDRRAYREMLFTTPGIGQFISGVIMFDETIRQKASDGTPMPEVLVRRGIVPGIKVDCGAQPIPMYPGESITEGLDRLRDRLAEYYKLGARFTKWRAVIAIGDGIPTDYCIQANADALARYAALSQEAGMVPIVEPEVLMDGDHTIEGCAVATEKTLRMVFTELGKARVLLEGTLLKPNMVLPGKNSPQHVSVQDVARTTVRVLRESVPPAVPGIMFLSGGQSPEQATERLNAMNQLGSQPWALAFSFARALQEPVMAAWRGKPENVPEAQRIFLRLAENNHEARYGACHPSCKMTQHLSILCHFAPLLRSVWTPLYRRRRCDLSVGVCEYGSPITSDTPTLPYSACSPTRP